MKISQETLIATAQPQIALLNSDLEAANRRAGDLQEKLDAAEREIRRLRTQISGQSPSLFGRDSDGDRSAA